MTFDTLYLRSVYVVVNDGYKPEAFIRLLERHFGDCHNIGEPNHKANGWSSQFVGFGGETWRGMLFLDGDRIVAFQLFPNFDMGVERLAVATCGLAELIHQKWARLSDVVPIE
jgi:hypothetical protein